MRTLRPAAQDHRLCMAAAGGQAPGARGALLRVVDDACAIPSRNCVLQTPSRTRDPRARGRREGPGLLSHACRHLEQHQSRCHGRNPMQRPYKSCGAAAESLPVRDSSLSQSSRSMWIN